MYKIHPKKGSFKTALLKLRSKDSMKREYIFVYMNYILHIGGIFCHIFNETRVAYLCVSPLI